MGRASRVTANEEMHSLRYRFALQACMCAHGKACDIKVRRPSSTLLPDARLRRQLCFAVPHAPRATRTVARQPQSASCARSVHSGKEHKGPAHKYMWADGQLLRLKACLLEIATGLANNSRGAALLACAARRRDVGIPLRHRHPLALGAAPGKHVTAQAARQC